MLSFATRVTLGWSIFGEPVRISPPYFCTEGLMSIDLGLPTLPPPTLAPRRKSRQIKVGKVAVGGDAPVSVQSMTTTLTGDINATLQQIAELTATGCDIVRVAVPSQDDADALPIIAKKSQISRSSPTFTSSPGMSSRRLTPAVPPYA